MSHFQLVIFEKIQSEMINAARHLKLLPNRRLNLFFKKDNEEIIKSLNNVKVLSVYLLDYQKYFTDSLDKDFFNCYFDNLLKKYRSCYYHVLNQLKEFIELLDFLISKEKQELI
ncbi:hypothetical protein B279_04740 [Streptococcus equinus ATCC 33317]|nr:hypothetical protein B279_04740 [Streptococcus equinus ATCC 33317]